MSTFISSLNLSIIGPNNVTFSPQNSELDYSLASSLWWHIIGDSSSLTTSKITGINISSKEHGIATDPFNLYHVACFGDGVNLCPKTSSALVNNVFYMGYNCG